MRGPLGAGGEEAARYGDLIRKEKAEADAEQARGERHGVVPAGEPATRVTNRERQNGGHHHHSRDGSQSEKEQVGDGPPGVADRRHHYQRDGRGPGQSVNDSNYQRTERVVKSHLAQRALEPAAPPPPDIG